MGFGGLSTVGIGTCSVGARKITQSDTANMGNLTVEKVDYHNGSKLEILSQQRVHTYE